MQIEAQHTPVFNEDTHQVEWPKSRLPKMPNADQKVAQWELSLHYMVNGGITLEDSTVVSNKM
jgi:hypothetical protein